MLISFHVLLPSSPLITQQLQLMCLLRHSQDWTLCNLMLDTRKNNNTLLWLFLSDIFCAVLHCLHHWTWGVLIWDSDWLAERPIKWWWEGKSFLHDGEQVLRVSSNSSHLSCPSAWAGPTKSPTHLTQSCLESWGSSRPPRRSSSSLWEFLQPSGHPTDLLQKTKKETRKWSNRVSKHMLQTQLKRQARPLLRWEPSVQSEVPALGLAAKV